MENKIDESVPIFLNWFRKQDTTSETFRTAIEVVAGNSKFSKNEAISDEIIKGICSY